MKISNRQYKNTSIIMSIRAAVLCALAVTAQAGNNPRIVTDLPKETTKTQIETLPRPISDPREVILDGPVTKGPLELRDQPELVPVTMEAWFDHEETDEIWGHTRRYGASITVANWGKAKAADSFYCAFRIKVLDSINPAKYPVGMTIQTGLLGFFPMDVMDMQTHSTTNNGIVDDTIHIPFEITKCELSFRVDIYYAYLGGSPVFGHIDETDENNNYSDPILISNPWKAEQDFPD